MGWRCVAEVSPSPARLGILKNLVWSWWTPGTHSWEFAPVSLLVHIVRSFPVWYERNVILRHEAEAIHRAGSWNKHVSNKQNFLYHTFPWVGEIFAWKKKTEWKGFLSYYNIGDYVKKTQILDLIISDELMRRNTICHIIRRNWGKKNKWFSRCVKRVTWTCWT